MPKTETAAPAGKTEKLAVLMEDGTTVEFTSKQKLVKTTSIDEVAGTITVRLDFRNGAVLHYNMLPDLILRFAGHGAEQKLGDIIAGEDDLNDAVESVRDLITRLDAGEWNAKREKGAFSGQSILLRAMVEAADGKKTVDEVRAFLATKTPAEKSALRGSRVLAPIVQRLEAEKASRSKKPSVDTDALLGELGI